MICSVSKTIFEKKFGVSFDEINEISMCESIAS